MITSTELSLLLRETPKGKTLFIEDLPFISFQSNCLFIQENFEVKASFLPLNEKVMVERISRMGFHLVGIERKAKHELECNSLLVPIRELKNFEFVKKHRVC